jgi:hypothetical protein
LHVLRNAAVEEDCGTHTGHKSSSHINAPAAHTSRKARVGVDDLLNGTRFLGFLSEY